MMTIATRQKAIRHLVSAILSSGFTGREVDEICLALTKDNNFATDLSSALSHVSQHLSGPPKIKRDAAGEKKPDLANMLAENVAILVKHNEVTQRELLNIMSAISPNIAISLEGKRLPTVEIIHRFLSNVNEEKRVNFLKILSNLASPHSPNRDSYLDLITEKLNK